MERGVSIEAAAPDSPDAAALLARLDAELHERYPRGSVHGFSPEDIHRKDGVFLIARVADQPVGCGAVRPLSGATGEIKRMFVEPSMRRRGIARAILMSLEEASLRLGFEVLRLETGRLQPEAIRLYEAAGYARIPSFGEYASDPWSVCFEKSLRPGR